jgi:hypothetical protein
MLDAVAPLQRRAMIARRPVSIEIEGLQGDRYGSGWPKRMLSNFAEMPKLQTSIST